MNRRAPTEITAVHAHRRSARRAGRVPHVEQAVMEVFPVGAEGALAAASRTTARAKSIGRHNENGQRQ